MRWDAYARVNPLGEDSYRAEPVQQARVETIARRAVGRTLDVGGGEGYGTAMVPDATCVDISPLRATRARDRGVEAEVADACALPHPDGSVDTVILGEILEHLDNPGAALTEACRVAKERVIVSLPLNGWVDPTHQWRISLDHLVDEHQRADDATRGEQIVLTFQRGVCWPDTYYETNPAWHAQFVEGR